MNGHGWGAAFLASLVSGLLPVGSGEVVLLGAIWILPASERPLFVLVCAAGQVVGKLGVFTLVRWFPSRMPARARAALERAGSLRRGLGGFALLTLASAAVGVPPFYLVTVAGGAIGTPLPLFAVAGLAGTVLRYAGLAWGAAGVSSLTGFLFP